MFKCTHSSTCNLLNYPLLTTVESVVLLEASQLVTPAIAVVQQTLTRFKEALKWSDKVVEDPMIMAIRLVFRLQPADELDIQIHLHSLQM